MRQNKRAIMQEIEEYRLSLESEKFLVRRDNEKKSQESLNESLEIAKAQSDIFSQRMTIVKELKDLGEYCKKCDTNTRYSCSYVKGGSCLTMGLFD